MSIIVTLDVMLARRKMKSKRLAELIGVTEQNLSLIKTGKIKGIRLATLNKICRHLECQPGDILEYIEDRGDGQARPAKAWGPDRGAASSNRNPR